MEKRDAILITGFTPFDRLSPFGVDRLMPNSSEAMVRIIAGSLEIKNRIAQMFGVQKVDVEFLEVKSEWGKMRLWDEAVREASERANLIGAFSLGAGFQGMKEGGVFSKLHRGILAETEARNTIYAKRMGIESPITIDDQVKIDGRITHPHTWEIVRAVSGLDNPDIQVHIPKVDGIGAGIDMCNYVLYRMIGRLREIGSLEFGGFVHVNSIMSEDWRDALTATASKANHVRRLMKTTELEGNPQLTPDEIDEFKEKSRVLPPEESVELFQTFLRAYAAQLTTQTL